MKLLIFGAPGAVGTALEAECLRRKIPCVPLRRVDADVTDAATVSRVISQHRPTVVVNSVALVGIKLCEDDPQRAFAVNALAARSIAIECERIGASFVQPSSHAVFDGSKEGAYTEDDFPAPLNTYAITKFAAERFALTCCSRGYVVRFPTLFGPRRNTAPGFADKMLERLRGGEPIRAPTDKIDSPTYTLDAARLLLDMLVARMPVGVYHIANAGSASYFEFVSRMAEILGVRASIEQVSDADFDSGAKKPLRTAMQSVKLDPVRGWDAALTEYLKGMK